MAEGGDTDNDNLEHLVVASDTYSEDSSVASSQATGSDFFESCYEDTPPRSHCVPARSSYTSTSGLDQDDAVFDQYATILDPTLREYGHKMGLEDRTLMILHTEGFKTMDLARELTVEDVKAMQAKEHYRLVPIMQFKIITKAVQMRFYDPDFVPRLKDTGTQMEIPTEGKPLKPENLVNRQCRVIILGRTGSGKSTLANKLLGRPDKKFTNPLKAVEEAAARKPDDSFFVGSSVSAITKTSQFGTTVQNGIELTVVDTPGLFDTDRLVNNKHVQIELTRGLVLVGGKPHAFIIVVKLGRVTQEVQNAFQTCIRLFGTSHVIVAFSMGEQLEESALYEEDVLSIETAADKGNKELKAILEVVRATGRYVVVTNYPSRRQAEVDLLMEKINEVSDELRNPWSNTKLQYLAEEFQRYLS